MQRGVHTSECLAFYFLLSSTTYGIGTVIVMLDISRADTLIKWDLKVIIGQTTIISPLSILGSVFFLRVLARGQFIYCMVMVMFSEYFHFVVTFHDSLLPIQIDLLL